MLFKSDLVHCARNYFLVVGLHLLVDTYLILGIINKKPSFNPTIGSERVTRFLLRKLDVGRGIDRLNPHNEIIPFETAMR